MGGKMIKKIINKESILTVLLFILYSLLLVFVIEWLSRGSIEAAYNFLRHFFKIFLYNVLIVSVTLSPCFLFRRRLFAYNHYDLHPDIVTIAKGIGAGISVSGVLTNEKTSEVLSPGDHGSTFGGNILAMTAASVVIDELESPGFYEEVEAKGKYIKDYIKSLGLQVDKYINAGFLLINASLQRKDNLFNEFKRHLNKQYQFQDQDIINIVCKDRLTFLPLKYCFQ